MKVYVVIISSWTSDDEFTNVLAVCDTRELANAFVSNDFAQIIENITQKESYCGISKDSMKCRKEVYGYTIYDEISGARIEWCISEEDLITSNK